MPESVGKPSLNAYAYCENNPINYVDPWVFFAIGATGQVGFLAGVAPLGGGAAQTTGFVGYFSGQGYGTASQSNAGNTGRATTGAYGGGGLGAFFSNANTGAELAAIGNQFSFGAGLGFEGASFTVGWGNGKFFVAAYPLGPSAGAYVSKTSGGCQ